MPIVTGQDNTAQLTTSKGVKQTAVNTQYYSPKFFNGKVLTGKGGQSPGLLRESRDPKMYKNGYKNKINPNMQPDTQHNGNLKIYNIPCYIISIPLWDYITSFARPDISEMTKVATRGTEEIYITMPLHAIQVEEMTTNNIDGTSNVSRDLSACMHLFVFSVKDQTQEKHQQMQTIENMFKNTGSYNMFYRDITYDIFTPLRNLDTQLSANGYTVDRPALENFVQTYSLYDELCKAAEKWITKADYFVVDTLVENIKDYTHNSPNSLWTHAKLSPSDYDRSVFDVLAKLEKYSISLDQYDKMYNKMKQILNKDILFQICKANLNLKLSNTLQHMNENRDQLQFCPCTNHATSKIPFSIEQKRAIESTSPLTLVQSGAGTGKSTVILGRIDHMMKNGIDPKDITVLSFTNAAADHIKDLKPNIHSMTIASMLHTIYSYNFPTHQLSSLATIINSLDIYLNPNIVPMSDKQINFVANFKIILERLQSNNEYTKANNFIEQHIDEVIDTLDKIEQTSLELESIVCYQKMDTLVEPVETQTKHLIIDEVQDNSIAEFIYSIKYTDKHKCSMYIVGDCSQTLYEFRASNPKALNVLEKSGVFETFKLQTNYRSNQEILDFANVLLGNIEANKYANIRLKANDLTPVTLQSFKEAVQLKYYRMNKKSYKDYDDMIMHSIAVDTRPYILDKLQKGEQVCILAHTRNVLQKIQDNLEVLYPSSKGKIVSLVPKKQYDNAIFSKFIAKYWDSIKYAPPTNIITTIGNEINNRIEWLTYQHGATGVQKVTQIVSNMMRDFASEYGNTINSWQYQVTNSMMSQTQMLNEIKKLMLAYEIKQNSIAQAFTSAKNTQRKNDQNVNDADFVLSTIHSAKGLEFDNVLIYYKNESEAVMDEATKRMYYVAFTRAKKTEYIFAYDTMARPKIESDYEEIIQELDKKDKLTLAKKTASATNATTTVKIAPKMRVAKAKSPALKNKYYSKYMKNKKIKNYLKKGGNIKRVDYHIRHPRG